MIVLIQTSIVVVAMFLKLKECFLLTLLLIIDGWLGRYKIFCLIFEGVVSIFSFDHKKTLWLYIKCLCRTALELSVQLTQCHAAVNTLFK